MEVSSLPLGYSMCCIQLLHSLSLSLSPDEWLMFDDDEVSPVSSEDILRLSGGGDWHCAYVLLYGPRILELREGEELGKKVSEEEQMETNQSEKKAEEMDANH